VKAALSTIAHLLLTGLTVYVLAWAALLSCSGDTDGCSPSAVNDLLMWEVLGVGASLALAVPGWLIVKARRRTLTLAAAVVAPAASWFALIVSFVASAALLSLMDGR
jgi:hypothetical protein